MADRIDPKALGVWYEKILNATMPHLTAENAQALATNASSMAIEYVKNNPKKAAVQAIGFGLAPILGNGWMLQGVLKLVGSGPLGPVAGSVAAWYQGTFLGGYISPTSLFAACQRIMMG